MAFTSGQAVFATGTDTTESKTAANARTALGLVIGTDVLAPSTILRSYLATTVTYTSDDTLGDTALSVTVASGGIYKVELQVLADIGAGGLRCDIGGTATITNFLVDTNVSNDATWTPAGRYTATSDIGIAGSFAADTASIYVTGSVEINAGGTFLLRGSQNLTNVASTSILRGSTLILTKMS